MTVHLFGNQFIYLFTVCTFFPVSYATPTNKEYRLLFFLLTNLCFFYKKVGIALFLHNVDIINSTCTKKNKRLRLNWLTSIQLVIDKTRFLDSILFKSFFGYFLQITITSNWYNCLFLLSHYTLGRLILVVI